MKGIEPSYAVWETAVLPLNYTREKLRLIPANYIIRISSTIFKVATDAKLIVFS